MTAGGTGDGRDDGLGPREADLKARLERLGRKIDAIQGRETAEEAGGDRAASPSSGFARAARLSSEFVGGILVGGGLGWLIDYALGTSPLGMIVFLLLGFAVGVINVIRAAGSAGGGGSEPPSR